MSNSSATKSVPRAALTARKKHGQRKSTLARGLSSKAGPVGADAAWSRSLMTATSHRHSARTTRVGFTDRTYSTSAFRAFRAASRRLARPLLTMLTMNWV